VIDYVAAIRSESSAFYNAAAGADPDARVPSCPEWSVRDLVLHLAQVHYFWSVLVENLVTDLAELDKLVHPDPPEEYGALLAVGRETAERLATALSNADQTARIWSWADRDDVAFVTRHQVQEAAIHRWDLENALGAASPITPDVADDSVDEFLRISLPSRDDWKPPADTVHIHATDTGSDWFIEPSGNIEGRPGSADVTLSATASDLLLGLYRRIELEDVDAILGGLAFT
jgi:uncharacterized protein (TIGR03083 family)